METENAKVTEKDLDEHKISVGAHEHKTIVASSSTTSLAGAAMSPQQPSPSPTGLVEDTSPVTPVISAQQLSHSRLSGSREEIPQQLLEPYGKQPTPQVPEIYVVNAGHHQLVAGYGTPVHEVYPLLSNWDTEDAGSE